VPAGAEPALFAGDLTDAGFAAELAIAAADRLVGLDGLVSAVGIMRTTLRCCRHRHHAGRALRRERAEGRVRQVAALAAAILGGTALFGGVGSVLKSLAGALILVTLKNGFNILNLGANWQG